MRAAALLILAFLMHLSSAALADDFDTEGYYRCKLDCRYYAYGVFTVTRIETQADTFSDASNSSIRQCHNICNQAHHESCEFRNSDCQWQEPSLPDSQNGPWKCNANCNSYNQRIPSSFPINGSGSTKYFAAYSAKQACADHCFNSDDTNCSLSALYCWNSDPQ